MISQILLVINNGIPVPVVEILMGDTVILWGSTTVTFED